MFLIHPVQMPNMNLPLKFYLEVKFDKEDNTLTDGYDASPFPPSVFIWHR